jgi:hypothetical protein
MISPGGKSAQKVIQNSNFIVDCTIRSLMQTTRLISTGRSSTGKNVGRVKKHFAASLPNRLFFIMLFSTVKERQHITGLAFMDFYLAFPLILFPYKRVGKDIFPTLTIYF